MVEWCSTSMEEKNGMVEWCSTSMEEKNGMVEWSSTSMVEMQILKQLIWSLFYFAWTVIERGLCQINKGLNQMSNTMAWKNGVNWTSVYRYIHAIRSQGMGS
jgi:hypothetical protein